MTRMRHKRNHHARRDISRGARTRARKLDHDQIQSNLEDNKKYEALTQPDHLDIDLPGLGLFYCVECDRHFPSQVDKDVHSKSKLHKRIAKRMREEKAYTVEESYLAAGVGVDNKQRNRGEEKEIEMQIQTDAGQRQTQDSS
ncbi:hypothetical protein CBS101457_001200 [Exobasidium rhododendri]|nr:hypothetical protein CBS101457_001200 [Exobasidium rhododendri]